MIHELFLDLTLSALQLKYPSYGYTKEEITSILTEADKLTVDEIHAMVKHASARLMMAVYGYMQVEMDCKRLEIHPKVMEAVAAEMNRFYKTDQFTATSVRDVLLVYKQGGMNRERDDELNAIVTYYDVFRTQVELRDQFAYLGGAK